MAGESGWRATLAGRVVYGAGLLAAAGVVSRLFSFASSPILTRLLGPTPYGVVALVGTVTSFGATAALLGIDLAYGRYFFTADQERAAAVERFCWRFAAVTAVVAAALLGSGWFFLSGDDLRSDLSLMVAAGTLLPALSVMVTTLRRIRGSYGRIAISIVVSGGVGALLSILLAMFFRPDAWAILLGTAGGLLAGSLVAGLPSLAILTVPSGLSWRSRWEIVQLGLAGVVMAPMLWVINSADRWLIGIWHGQEPLGVYAFALTIGQVGLMLNNGIIITWFPEMLRVYEGDREAAADPIGRTWSKLAVGLMVVWLAVTAGGGDLIRLLAPPAFHRGASYVPWIAAGIFFYGISALATTGHAIRMRLKPVALWWTAAAALNVVMNLLLVRSLGARGGAIAAAASFALLAAGTMVSAQKRYQLPVPWSRLGAAMALAVVLGAVMTPAWNHLPFLSLALKLPAGALAALALFWLGAPDWVRKITARDFFR
jgi:O-antigen/teichoic acid export membrane protein